MPMKLTKGTKVYIKAEIIRQLEDARPDDEKGYQVATSRGKVYVNPDEILVPLTNRGEKT